MFSKYTLKSNLFTYSFNEPNYLFTVHVYFIVYLHSIITEDDLVINTTLFKLHCLAGQHSERPSTPVTILNLIPHRWVIKKLHLMASV